MVIATLALFVIATLALFVIATLALFASAVPLMGTGETLGAMSSPEGVSLATIGVRDGDIFIGETLGAGTITEGVSVATIIGVRDGDVVIGETLGAGTTTEGVIVADKGPSGEEAPGTLSTRNTQSTRWMIPVLVKILVL